MQKIIVGFSEPILLIDKYHRGDGLWFDRGELKGIIDRAQLDKDNKIQKILADMFSQEQKN
jgi:Zn-finger nucleic acid-binding protein